MIRQKHDQFSKQYLGDLLEPDGQVYLNYEIQGVSRYADIYFTPTTVHQNLGLLTQMTTKACLLEPFRKQPSKVEIRQCMLKLFALHGELIRQANKNTPKNSLPENALPSLWIITTSASDNLLNFFNAELKLSQWGEGVYFFNQGFRSAIVVADRLPTTPDTLWLRILGKEKTQQQAIDEIMAFPKGNALRSNVLELLSTWHINLETKNRLTTDDKELLMNLSPAYEKWREETLQQGVKQAQRVFVKSWLRSRFGKIDKVLSPVVEPLVQLPLEESARLLPRLSREELLARFGKKS
ncbi:MAG: hypothetical protein B6247_15260 [Candidatus Parabeggiatoa sp. nov. 2]|nr:MAG: hypothetical protein B6247_15260 [Beggiatoa sp. 4572_84]